MPSAFHLIPLFLFLFLCKTTLSPPITSLFYQPRPLSAGDRVPSPAQQTDSQPASGSGHQSSVQTAISSRVASAGNSGSHDGFVAIRNWAAGAGCVSSRSLEGFVAIRSRAAGVDAVSSRSLKRSLAIRSWATSAGSSSSVERSFAVRSWAASAAGGGSKLVGPVTVSSRATGAVPDDNNTSLGTLAAKRNRAVADTRNGAVAGSSTGAVAGSSGGSDGPAARPEVRDSLAGDRLMVAVPSRDASPVSTP